MVGYSPGVETTLDIYAPAHSHSHTLTHTHTHTHRYTKHEEAIKDIAREMGFSHVSLSSAVMPMVRIVQRGYTGRHWRTLPNIYLYDVLESPENYND